MTYSEFKNILKEENVELKTWCTEMDISYSTATKWKYEGVPQIVSRYFELFIEKKKLIEAKNAILNICKTIKN